MNNRVWPFPFLASLLICACGELAVVEILEPFDGDHLPALEVDVTGTVEARNGVERLEVNGVIADLSRDGTFSARILLEKGAGREISVLLEDNAGNIIDPAARIWVTIDPDPPSVEVLSPERGGCTKERIITLEGRASDEFAVSSVTVNGVEARDLEEGFSLWEATVDLEGDNCNELEVVATDTAGNTASPEEPFYISLCQGEVTERLDDELAIPETLSMTMNGTGAFIGWGLNDERFTLYDTLSDEISWEYDISEEEPYKVIALTEPSGDTLVGAFNDTLLLFSIDSSTPFHQETFTGGTIASAKIARDGLHLALFLYYGGTETIRVILYDLSSYSLTWQWESDEYDISYDIDVTDDGGKILVPLYDHTYLIEGGEVVWERMEQSGGPAAISGDGTVIADGNYEGRLRIFQWNEEEGDYETIYTYRIPPEGGYYNWISAVDADSDGSKVVCGSFEILEDGSSGGRVALIDTTIPGLEWEFLHGGDLVDLVAFFPDGERILGGGWGDLDNEKADLWVFDTACNSPILDFNTAGSVSCALPSPSGDSLLTGAKAVHMRELGAGGYLYSASL